MAELDLQKMRELVEVGFTKYSGIKVTHLEEGRAVCEMEITANHLNPLHTVHGGAVYSLADVVGGISTRTLGGNPTTGSSTINYMRPTIGCTKLIGDARVLKLGKTISVVEIAIYDQNNREVARVMSNYFDLGDTKPQN